MFAERYQIIRRLGSGGMGEVYLARHLQMERLSAIKLLHPDLRRDPESLARFTREAKSASGIIHPNVCAIFDFGTTPDGRVYIAMEFVEGRSLGAMLAEGGALPIRRAVRLLGEAAAGLNAAHELGIVHRDLKPDNMMVATVRGRETVKLVDFGIAKALEPELGRDVTAAGVVVGTPDYMAPEQFAGDPVDTRSDLYSLALVFYRMVTGTLPFKADTARETLARRLVEPPDPLAVAVPGIAFPPGLQPVLDRALSRRPQDRFASAAEFAQALRDSVAELPPEDGDAGAATVRLDAVTEAISRPVPASRPARPRRRVVRVIAGAVLLGGAGVVVAVLNQGPGIRNGAGQPDTGSAAPTSQAPPPATTVPPANPTGSTRPLPPPSVDPGGKATQAAGGRPADTGTTAAVRRDTSGSGMPPLPTLPTPDELEDPGTRGAARTVAEQIYQRVDAGPVLRAQAAFALGVSFNAEGRYREAEIWTLRAEQMIQTMAPGVEQETRRKRYHDFLGRVRALLRERTPP
jgi:serine/threonine-protein kinase